MPFTIHVGENDGWYGRNQVAREWGKKLDVLQTDDPGGYLHVVQLHAGRGHWMNLEDQTGVDWISQFTRCPIPQRVVWKQNEVTHDNFYWLSVPRGTAVNNAQVIVQRNGQSIEVVEADGVNKITIWFDNRVINCDLPVVVKFGGRELFLGNVRRTISTEQATLDDRGDRDFMFDSSVTVDLPIVKSPATTPSTRSSIDSPEVMRAASYLKAHLQSRDRSLSDAFLQKHAAAILSDSETRPWRNTVPAELFDEYVLPFATLDESREAWVDSMKPVAMKLVASVKTCGEAAEILNNGIFDQLGVHYNATRRLKPDQSVSESISSGYASCTGLSIILVNACRSVGIPARVVGVSDWVSPKGPTFQGNGNHTWVEVWDGRQWRFIGAGEKSKLDQTWFAERAKLAVEQTDSHAIFAACFRDSLDHFPMVWSIEDTTVPAVNVTSYYTNRKIAHVEGPPDAKILIRDLGRLVAAGAPGDFIVAGKRDYSVEIITKDGATHSLSRREE